MRILHSIRSVNPAGGGPIEGINQLYIELKKIGHEIEILCLDKKDCDWVKKSKIKCHALGKGFGVYGLNINIIRWLIKNRIRYDVIIINGIWQFHSLGTFIGLIGSNIPYYVYPHGMLDPWFKKTYKLKHFKKFIYWYLFEYYTFKFAKRIMFTCKEEEKLAKESFPYLYNFQTFVSGYGISHPDIDNNSCRLLFLKKYPHLAQNKCIIYLGRLHEKKGIDMLLESFSNTLLKVPSSISKDLHLIICGSGAHKYEEYLNDFVIKLNLEKKVTFTGLIQGNVKFGALLCSDLFALCSHQENFGLSIVESLALSIPVIITNKVNIFYEIKDYNAGFITDDTVTSFTNGLINYLNTDNSTRSNMRNNAYICYVNNFNTKNLAVTLTSLFSNDANK